MAPIAILISSMIGFLTGLVQFAFLGVTLAHAFFTYMAVSVMLSALAITMALLSDQRRWRLSDRAAHETLENWQDWQTEEAMEADRLSPVVNTSDMAKRARKSA